MRHWKTGYQDVSCAEKAATITHKILRRAPNRRSSWWCLVMAESVTGQQFMFGPRDSPDHHIRVSEDQTIFGARNIVHTVKLLAH